MESPRASVRAQGSSSASFLKQFKEGEKKNLVSERILFVPGAFKPMSIEEALASCLRSSKALLCGYRDVRDSSGIHVLMSVDTVGGGATSQGRWPFSSNRKQGKFCLCLNCSYLLLTSDLRVTQSTSWVYAALRGKCVWKRGEKNSKT